MSSRRALANRRAKGRGRGEGASTTGLTPLVDVVFLLLLFLVLTARFIPKENRFDLKLPESQPPNVEKYLEPFRLEVRAAEGAYGGAVLYAGGALVASATELVETLRALPAQIPVVVVGDDEVPYAAVVAAYDACLAAKRKRIVLSVAERTRRVKGVGVGLAAWALLVSAPAHPAAAAGLETRADAALRAGSLAGLQAVVREAGGAIRDQKATRPAQLADLIAALDRVEAGIGSLRERRENDVANDEAALEALYESREWLRFEHLEGELQYWRGWAHFRAASQRPADSTEARASFRAARRDFSKAMRNIRDPAVARETLLVTAIAERGAGSASQSAETLARVASLFGDAPAEFQARLRLERARTAHALGQRREVLTLAQDADLASAPGRELADLRLRTLLAGPAYKASELGAAARPMLRAGGDAAARAVTALETAQLPSATLRALELGPEGNALEGLALLREERYPEAADRLASAAGGSLAGLRDDVVLARLAEAQLRARRGADAFATCRRLRSRFPDSTLRAQVARFAYNAAQLWNAADAAPAAAADALETASAWVLADAPTSEEAAEIRVRRAMRTASRSHPDRALRVLEGLPQGAPGSEAVTLQKALLRSAKIQTGLEAALRRTPSLRRQGQQLDRLLRGLEESREGRALAAQYPAELALARARALLALGHAGALEQLRGLAASLEVERTRILALWVGGDAAAALRATRDLVEAGPGSARLRFGWALPVALAASERPAADPAALRDLLGAIRARAPEDMDPEFRLELALREGRAAQRGGENDAALALARDVLAQGPETLSNRVLLAELFEEGGNPGRATEVWHGISEVTDRAGDDWLRARVGVARSLRATPGRAQDGCDVATSLVVSGRSLLPQLESELRAIAGSCDTLSALEREGRPGDAAPSADL